jgi:SAM-dependent methyltransferase
MVVAATASDSRRRPKQCPVCEHPYNDFYLELGDRFRLADEERFALYRCSSCGLLFQDPNKIRHRLSELYPSGYWWREQDAVSSLERLYREWVVRHDQLRFLRSVLPRPQGKRLLDIGCGDGVFVKLANNAGYDAYGLERAPEAARLAEQSSPGKIHNGSEDQLIDSGEAFDFLVLLHSLEHILDPYRYLKKLECLLRQPGGLIVQVPNLKSVQAGILKSRWYGLDCPRHVCNYTECSLLHLLGRCGYRVERIRHFSLRDNAAAIVSSVLPGLDPITLRVRSQGLSTGSTALRRTLTDMLYFGLVVMGQPLAWLEAALNKGGTLTVYAVLGR